MANLLTHCRNHVLHLPSYRLPNYAPQMKRSLTIAEAAVALRPFLFTVHPDLFGKFPKEQAINEQSLKLLNEYIHRLNSRQEVKPVSLMFYMRNNSVTQDSMKAFSGEAPLGKFQSVELQLVARNLQETVRSILFSCKLPLDYIESVKPVATAPSPQDPLEDKQSLWEAVAKASKRRSTGGARFEFFSEFQPRKQSKDDLVEWLKKNVLKAHQRNLVTLPVRQDIRKLRETLQEETGVADVRWESDWAQASFRTALKNLIRICNSYSKEMNLKGRTVIFGNDTGVCIRGNIILRYDSVPNSWVPVLLSPHKLNGALDRIPSMERKLSSLLNDIVIVSQSYLPVVLADDYLRQLLRLVESIESHQAKEGDKAKITVDLTGVELVVECATGPLMISQSGQILVPSSCPAFLIADYINANAAKARQICAEFKQTVREHQEVVSHCHSLLGLETLTADSNVSRQQMVSCCSRLARLSDMRALDIDLTSCRLRVTHFYSVMSDGDICIPWNFEEAL